MSIAFDLPESVEPSPEPDVPQVFARAFSTPAGMPWEQDRAARLEVTHGSPVPVAELMWRLRRLERWALGRAGRFAVFYIRKREFRTAFEATVDVEGQAVRVAFGTARRSPGNLGAAAAVAVLAGATLLFVAGGSLLALDARGDGELQLVQLEQKLAGKSRQARDIQRLRARDEELVRLVGPAAPLDAVLGELAWVSTAKAADSRIQAFHWDRGLVALEARGEAAPVLAFDRPVERSRQPIRPGVYLWGVGANAETGARR